MSDFNYQQYQKIEAATGALSTLLINSGKFDETMRGYPEDFKKLLNGTRAGIYFNGIDFDQTHGERNIPQFIYHTLYIIRKGTKKKAHDGALARLLYVTSKFDTKEGDADWITLNANVRNTIITGANIYPELNKSKSSLLTTAIIQLKHDVRW